MMEFQGASEKIGRRRRLSKAQKADLIDLVITMIGLSMSTRKICRRLKAEPELDENGERYDGGYGLSQAQAERYIRQAREAMEAESGLTRKEVVTEAMEAQRTIIQNATRDKQHHTALRAREGLNRMLGYKPDEDAGGIRPINVNFGVEPEQIEDAEMSE